MFVTARTGVLLLVWQLLRLFALAEPPCCCCCCCCLPPPQVYETISGGYDEVDLNGRSVNARAYCSW
jgi:hypothetical protein